jgi:hypothetical protein
LPFDASGQGLEQEQRDPVPRARADDQSVGDVAVEHETFFAVQRVGVVSADGGHGNRRLAVPVAFFERDREQALPGGHARQPGLAQRRVARAGQGCDAHQGG